MNDSPETSNRAGRTRRLTLLSAPPLAALAFGIYAFTGVQAPADAGDATVPAPAAPAAIEATPYAAPISPEENLILREHDAELLSYRTYGG
jgi:hypothetical protein